MMKFWLTFLMYGIRLFEGENSGGGGDGGDAGGDAGAGAGTDGDNSGAASSADGGAANDGRPDGLEDSFWDGEAKQVRLDSLIKSHNDTKAAFSSKEEAIREKLMADIQQARPESPEKYEVKPLDGVEVPEGYEIKFDEKDPMIAMWKQLAFQSNLSNDQFMEGVRTWVKFGLDNRLDPKAEIEKLGENGGDRVKRIELLMNKHLEGEQINHLSDVLKTSEGVVAMEKLLQGVGDSRLPNIEGQGDSHALTKDELQEMQRDPRYTGIGRARDPAFIAEVTKGFEKLYPGKVKTA